MQVVQSVYERRVDGILVAASLVALYEPVVEQMRTPIILINNQHQNPSNRFRAHRPAPSGGSGSGSPRHRRYVFCDVIDQH